MKTKFMLFNPCTSRDFLPAFNLDGHEIEMVEETRLLGLVLSSDLSWGPNKDSMVERSNKKLWFLICLKNLGESRHYLKEDENYALNLRGSP